MWVPILQVGLTLPLVQSSDSVTHSFFMLILGLIIHTLLRVLLLHVVSHIPSNNLNSVSLIPVQRRKRIIK